jgi:DNA-damage-inducible protein J
MKTASDNIRLDPAIKAEAEKTFGAFGLSLSEANNIFLHKAIMECGFPFEVRDPKPSMILLEAIEETEQIRKEYADGTRKPISFTNAHDLIQEIIAEKDQDGV